MGMMRGARRGAKSSGRSSRARRLRILRGRLGAVTRTARATIVPRIAMAWDARTGLSRACAATMHAAPTATGATRKMRGAMGRSRAHART